MPEKIAILCSDLHLSHRPPLARAREPDWYEAMMHPLDELDDLTGDNLPVICGGDVFDKWNSPPELINFALAELPGTMESVAGQHDLPHHSWPERRKSAYWTLVESGKIKTLDGRWEGEGKFVRRGFYWGEELSGREGSDLNEKIEEIRREGKTILIVSHALGTVQELCERCMLLKNGVIISSGETEKVVEEYLRISAAGSQE